MRKSFIGFVVLASVLTAVIMQPWIEAWFDSRGQLAVLKDQLSNSQAELISLREDNTELQLSVARRDRALSKIQAENRQLAAVANAQPTPVLCCMDGRLMLHFRSDSTDIESFYDSSLANFAQAARMMPGAVIEISGHTDRRGESEANLDLSLDRVHAVQERLRMLGLREVAFHTAANGTAAPLTRGSDIVENAFFDRRVELRLVNAGSQQVSMR